MSKRKPDPIITHDEWYKAMFAETVTEIPQGYTSADDIAEKVGRSASHIRSVLRKQVKEGILDEVKVRIGRSYISYYKPLKK